jgi:ATP-dependent Clp protease ATP-binding subunit ClpC
MSEYMEKHSVSKMIGSPPGYVGFEEGGQLSEQIRRNPYSVILFDEIEKAHPDVFNILLQVLDEGHITDNTGRTVDFKNTIIIMTSNIGALKITDRTSIGFSLGEDRRNIEIKHEVILELKKTFKPEMLNRIDEIVVFNALSQYELCKITDILLGAVTKRLETVGIICEFDESVKQYIAKAGGDKDYGARPLRRKIQSFIEDEFAQQILSGEISEGDNVICHINNDKLQIDKTVLSI